MHCPNCGNKVEERKYCRVCGLDLKLIAQLTQLQLSGSSSKKLLLIEQGALHRVYLKLIAGLFLIFGGFALIGAGKEFLPAQWAQAIAVVTSLAGLMLSIRPFLSLLRSQSLEKAPSSSSTGILPDSQARSEASITEGTTSLLELDPAKTTEREAQSVKRQ